MEKVNFQLSKRHNEVNKAKETRRWMPAHTGWGWKEKQRGDPAGLAVIMISM